jgi:putative peptidoglycan lipid II flippase
MVSLVRSTGIVALSTLCSRVLGLGRDVLMAATFGAVRTADVFYIAFMIPNLFRRLVAEGALTISFIPVYTETLLKDGEDESLKLAQKTLTIQFFAILAIVIPGMIFAPYFMKFFFGTGDTAEIFNLSVGLTRFMFPYLFFAGFVAFAMGYLNSRGHFFAPAFSPVLLNVGIIFGILFFRHFFDVPVYGVALGVLMGGLLQLMLQIPYMIKENFRLKVSFDFNHPGIRKIFRMLGPAMFGIAIYQINVLVSNLLATMLPEGSVSYIYYTSRLTELVLGVFIVSIGNVILPEMSRLSVLEDKGRFSKLFSDSVSSALFLAVPASAALITVGLPVISVVFMRGRFTFADAGLTHFSLIYASLGIVFVSILRILVPAFYSMKDTKTPVYSSAVSFLINASLGYVLMHTSLKHAGLTLAGSIAAAVQVVILLSVLNKRVGRIDFGKIFVSFMKYITAAALMAAAVYKIAGLTDWEQESFSIRLLFLFLIILSGSAVYFTACYLMRSSEMAYLSEKIKKKLL